VFPEGRENPRPSGPYHVVVVGAGSGGLISAAAAAGLGAKVALIEKHALGGDCLNVGCVPSKALLAASRAAHGARNAGDFGVRGAGDAEVDFEAAMERMRERRAEISPNDSVARFAELGVDVYQGNAVFRGPRRVEVDGQELAFSRAIVATGARAVLPPIPGLEDVGALTNETVFSLTRLPRRLAVVGGGPIGCELAQAFARFGSRVTLFEASERILLKDDEEAASVLREQLRRDGVEIVCGAALDRVEAAEGGKRVRFRRSEGEDAAEFDEILLGAGRAPNVEGMGLDAAGVDFDPKRGISVDDRLRTTNRRIFGVGDVCMDFKFTHTADATARIAVQNALFFGRKKHTALTIPWCTYTEPEVAHVGLNEREAREAHGEATRTFRQDFADLDRAVLEGARDGFVKVHAVRGRIVGATLVGPHAGDMVSEISTAMAGGVGLGQLASVIHPYPTLAEAIRKAGDAYNRAKLTPGVQKLFRTLLRRFD